MEEILTKYEKIIRQRVPRGWQVVPLGKCLKRITNGLSYNYENRTGHPVTRIETISEGTVDLTKVGYATDSEINSDYLVQIDDILFSHINSLGQIGKATIYQSKEELYHGINLLLLRTKHNCLNPHFLLYLLISQIGKKQAYRYAKRAVNQSSINIEEVRDYLIPLPPISEQERIIEIISLWDKVIHKTEKLISAKRKLKKALMQQLLTGNRRFEEFVESKDVLQTYFGPVPKDWTYLKVGEIAHEVSERNGEVNSIPVLSCTKYDGLVNSLEYFGKQVFSKDVSNYKVVRYHQFAYATNHIEEGSIGLLTHIDAGLVSPMYTVFKTNERVYPPFLYSLFKTELYRHIFQVNTSASINRRGSLRWNQFAKIHVALPELEEQKKISSVLSDYDKEIHSLEQKLELLKQQKRALMQKLLTGKIRVKG